MSAIHVGAARRDITVYEPGIPMFGWGIPTNVPEHVHTPLNVRAFTFFDTQTARRVAYVCADLGMISDALRLGLLERLSVIAPELGIDANTLMLTATHTHSGPSGYSHHLFYNLPNPGSAPAVLRALVDRAADAIVEAASTERPARITAGVSEVSRSAPVGFNRSLKAYNRNPEVTPVTWSQRRRAVDREMVVLRVDDAADGSPIGMLTWFPLHGTSVHSDTNGLHPDNKGVAAKLTEAELGPGSVATFAQSAAGDVTPNFRYDPRRGLVVGAGEDDYESANIAGRIQHEAAGRAWRSAGASAEPLQGLDIATLHIDMRGYEAAPRYTGGRRGRTTGAACVGITFLEGTREGPGPLLAAQPVTELARGMARARMFAHRRVRNGQPGWSAIHGAKFPFLGVGRGANARAFGGFEAARPALPGVIDPVVAAMIGFGDVEAVVQREWIPNVLVLQVLVIGDIAIVGLPLEPTTVAGYRVRVSVLSALRDRGVNRVICAGYTNGYAGYVTTNEEYQLQLYEGASTLHGQWSLAALQTRLDTLCGRLQEPPASRDMSLGPAVRPHRASEIYGLTYASAKHA